MTSQLFTPVTVGSKTYANRIAIAPMAQYMADTAGNFSDWHLSHLGMLGGSGAGLVMIEVTAVSPEGRCTPGDPTLCTDENERALADLLTRLRGLCDTPFGIQIGHAGRKGSMALPKDGAQPMMPEQGGWETLAPSARAFSDWPAPREMSETEITALIAAFAESAARAARAGVELIELHAAHGYLLHQFLSPLSNAREDAWGGSLENRMRLPLAVFDAMKAAAPDVALGVRLTGSDWIEGGITPAEAVVFAQELEKRGCAYVDVTSGALDPAQKIAIGPGYQVGFATEVKAGLVAMPVRAVGLITRPEQAEAIVAEGKADIVAIARAALANPHWPWLAAYRLGAKCPIPAPYGRAAPGVWSGWEEM